MSDTADERAAEDRDRVRLRFAHHGQARRLGLVSPVFGAPGERLHVIAGVLVYLFLRTPRAVALVIAKWVVVGHGACGQVRCCIGAGRCRGQCCYQRQCGAHGDGGHNFVGFHSPPLLGSLVKAVSAGSQTLAGSSPRPVHVLFIAGGQNSFHNCDYWVKTTPSARSQISHRPKPRRSDTEFLIDLRPVLGAVRG